MGGGRIIPRSLKTTGNKNCFQPKPKIFFKIIYDPFIFAKNSFSKIWSTNCDKDGFMCWSWATTLQRQNAENLKQIVPEKEYQGLSPNFHIHVSVSELYFPTMGLPVLLEEICRRILGIYKSLKDTWMWKLGLRPRYSQKRNICGASKIKLKKVNKKRTVTVRRVIIFFNISRRPLLICLQCCLHQFKTLKAVATATAAIVLLTPAKNLKKVLLRFLVVSPLFNHFLG